MDDTQPPKPDEPESPLTTDGDHLDQKIDDLLNDVESLTDELLDGDDADKDSSTADAPGQDPAREVIKDDVGLAADSPLIQDGQADPPEEVVAGVDKELDQMEELIARMGDPGFEYEGEAPSTEDHSPTESALHDDPSAAVDDIAAQIPSEADKVSDDISDLIAGDLAEKAVDEVPAEAPEAPPVKMGQTEVEKQLDADLDALLSSDPLEEEPAAPQAEVADSEPSEPAPTETEESEDTAEHADIESIPLLKLIKLRIHNRVRSWVGTIADKTTEGLVRLLDKADGPFCSLSPMTKEVLGYCALGTLAMGLIALVVALLS